MSDSHAPNGDDEQRLAAHYFAGVRRDWLAELGGDRDRRILEIGCGTGDTGAAALAQGLCGSYSAVELSPAAAKIAREQISEVVVGDVASVAYPWPQQTFDVLFASEVLEHLVDPWAVLRRLRPLLRPRALVFASSPNVAHYRVVAMLLRGDWALEADGPMDRTHLRWFTPATYRSMFEECGFDVTSVDRVTPVGWKGRVFNGLTLGRMSHLLQTQIDLRACVTA